MQENEEAEEGWEHLPSDCDARREGRSILDGPVVQRRLGTAVRGTTSQTVATTGVPGLPGMGCLFSGTDQSHLWEVCPQCRHGDTFQSVAAGPVLI